MKPTTVRRPRTTVRATSVGRRLAGRLGLAAVMALVLLASLSTIDGTYAMWREQADVTGPVVDSGTAQLTAEWVGGDDQNHREDLLPEESVRQQVTVTNTGDAPLTLSAHLDFATTGLELRAVGGESQQKFSTAALGTEGQQISVIDAPGSPLTVEPGQSAVVTVEFAATGSLAPGAEAAFTVVLDGEQTR